MASATKEQTMGELESFAEKLARDMLAQMQANHESEAERNDAFRAGLALDVARMQTTVALLGQKFEACTAECSKQICCLKESDKDHEREHRRLTKGFVAMLLSAIGSLGAALWATFRNP